ncbi:helix-turn-helix domain-containing protein [Acidaminococcus fermentans]|uniref:helix-turn-helix domain-containing protein n=1 Tax=Acidaminococcus fermentans TaxID=905 RepID=UPI00242B3BCC|nr:helix-turn-helix transcriptional regulator [Acidaminococcus fermentans]MCF0138814.1 helix-turn-helix transcriptional regulator [Acidaminococcus fermentans]MCI6285792.1 helix-turn-helix domain-containing protein [Acidaminococcus fermentans]MDY2852908.1 helix-turn-helix transcriptional regulator [Acidaminococcus fermentans]
MTAFTPLFAWLEYHGITLKQIAMDTNISVRTLSRMKNLTGKRNSKYVPSMKTLEEISKVTKLRIDEMMIQLPDDLEEADPDRENR